MWVIPLERRVTLDAAKAGTTVEGDEREEAVPPLDIIMEDVLAVEETTWRTIGIVGVSHVLGQLTSGLICAPISRLYKKIVTYSAWTCLLMARRISYWILSSQILSANISRRKYD